MTQFGRILKITLLQKINNILTWHKLTRHKLTWHKLTRHKLTRHKLTRHKLTRNKLTRHKLTRHKLKVLVYNVFETFFFSLRLKARRNQKKSFTSLNIFVWEEDVFICSEMTALYDRVSKSLISGKLSPVDNVIVTIIFHPNIIFHFAMIFHFTS